jgi:hypothetical protein
MIKSKASDRAIENSSRKSASQNNEEFMNTIVSNYKDIVSSLKNNEVSERLRQYEDRMKNFESEIHKLQMNMSQQMLLSSQNYNSKSPDKLMKTYKGPNLLGKRKDLDDTVNYRSKESFIINNGYGSNHQKDSILKDPKNESNASLRLLNSLKYFDNSAVQDEK